MNTPNHSTKVTARFPSGVCHIQPGHKVHTLRDGLGHIVFKHTHNKKATVTGVQHHHAGSPVDAPSFIIHLTM